MSSGSFPLPPSGQDPGPASDASKDKDTPSAGPQKDTNPTPTPCRLSLWELFSVPPVLSIGTKLLGVLLCRQYWEPGSSF